MKHAAVSSTDLGGGKRRGTLILLGLNRTIIAGRGTVRVPMLVRILRTFELPEILMFTAAMLCVVVSVYLLGG